MLAILSVLLIIALSILVTRVAAVALLHTGLSRDAARFQARSAFTGVGYTTQEAERVTRHPVRRRIAMTLMLLGNAGIVTVIASLVLGVVDPADSGPSLLLRLLILFGGVLGLWFLAASPVVDRWLSRLISLALKRWTDLDVRDYAQLLHLTGEYGVRELRVGPDDWLVENTLAQVSIRDEGIISSGSSETMAATSGRLGATRPWRPVTYWCSTVTRKLWTGWIDARRARRVTVATARVWPTSSGSAGSRSGGRRAGSRDRGSRRALATRKRAARTGSSGPLFP